MRRSFSAPLLGRIGLERGSFSRGTVVAVVGRNDKEVVFTSESPDKNSDAPRYHLPSHEFVHVMRDLVTPEKRLLNRSGQAAELPGARNVRRYRVRTVFVAGQFDEPLQRRLLAVGELLVATGFDRGRVIFMLHDDLPLPGFAVPPEYAIESVEFEALTEEVGPVGRKLTGSK